MGAVEDHMFIINQYVALEVQGLFNRSRVFNVQPTCISLQHNYLFSLVWGPFFGGVIFRPSVNATPALTGLHAWFPGSIWLSHACTVHKPQKSSVSNWLVHTHVRVKLHLSDKLCNDGVKVSTVFLCRPISSHYSVSLDLDVDGSGIKAPCAVSVRKLSQAVISHILYLQWKVKLYHTKQLNNIIICL